MPNPNPPFVVTVTPPNGTTPGSCDPNTVRPRGANALLRWVFPPGTTGWSFAQDVPIQIKSNVVVPAGMFQITANSGTQLTVLDKNGDGKSYPYTLKLLNNGTAVFIDPDIQNDLETTRG